MNLKKLQTAANIEEVLVKIILISEAKPRLLEVTKAKPAMAVTNIIGSLQFRSHAMSNSSSSSGKGSPNVEIEIEFNFKKI